MSIADCGQYGMPLRVPENPGGVCTLSPARFWSPSVRRSSTSKGEWAPGTWLSEAAWRVGENGRTGPGQGCPSGPESIVKNCWEVSAGRLESHGVKVLVTG